MATSTFLSQLTSLTVNAVDLKDQCTSINFVNARDSLEATSFGDTSRKYVGGLYINECTMTLYQSYVASETYATLAALVGTTTTIVASVTDGATTKTFTLTGAYLESLPVANMSLGELSTVDVTFSGGVFTAS